MHSKIINDWSKIKDDSIKAYTVCIISAMIALHSQCTSERFVIEEESLCRDVLRCVVTSLRTTSNGRRNPSICAPKNESDASSLSSCIDVTLNTINGWARNIANFLLWNIIIKTWTMPCLQKLMLTNCGICSSYILHFF